METENSKIKKLFNYFPWILLLLLMPVTYQYWGAPPSIVVIGQVVDEKDIPIGDAAVVASLGLDVDGRVTKTWKDGSFEATAASSQWGKGLPTIAVSKEGFQDYSGHFDKWRWGSRLFRVTIVLKRKPDNRPAPAKEH